MNNDAYQPYSYQPTYNQAPPATPTMRPAPQPVNQGGSRSGMMIALMLVFALISITFIVLFVWMYAQYADASTALDAKIDAAVIEAVDDNTAKLEAEYAEREKSPFKTFAGPVDYGELTFQYPKTWSVYEYASATNGGNFGVVFNPDKITSTSSDTVNALRLTIDNSSFESSIQSYTNSVNDGDLQYKVIQVNGINANLYYGTFRNGFVGAVVLIKIRDKTATLSTDSYTVFGNDFETLIQSIKYNA